MKILLLILAVGLNGCVSRKAALRYGQAMNDNGYAAGKATNEFEILRLRLENSYLKDAVRKQEQTKLDAYLERLAPDETVEKLDIQIQDKEK